MNIGLCTTDLKPMPADPLFEKIAAWGFRSVQLNFAAMEECGFEATGQLEIPGDVSTESVSAIREAARRHQLDIVCVNGTFNMAHPDAAVREEGVRRFRGIAQAIRALGAPCVTLCTGTRDPAHMWVPHPDNQSAGAWLDMARTMEKLAETAESAGLSLLIEVEASNVVDTPEKALRVLREIGSPALKIVMDCANLFHPGQARPELAEGVIRRAFDLLGEKVALAHGKDIRSGDSIDFCAAGEGIIDFALMLLLLKQAGYAGDMVLHGVYDEAKMRPAYNFMREKIACVMP